MRSFNHKRALAAAAATLLLLSGCATPQRLPAVPAASVSETTEALGPVRYLVSRETDTFKAEALRSVQKEEAYLRSKGWTPGTELPPVSFLAISGGGDNGAYGAGFLNGWTASGTRPEFKVVTGISTGALIAPFAFLGPKYDYVLTKVYTTSTQKDIFKKRGFTSLIWGDAGADTTPLAKIIASYVTPEFLKEIAAEYAKGRILLVGTTNLDTLEPVIWNMTAIAASNDPNAVSLFRSVLLGSASIPGAFPPVMIDVSLKGTHYQEMHVDGGTTTQVFLFPPSMSVTNAPQRKRTVYILRNARLDADWASTERRTMPIAMRSIDSLLRTQGIGDLYRIYATTQRDNIDFNLTFIPATFNVPHKEMFDTNYMNALYKVGMEAAQSGGHWQKFPPGFEAPVDATKQ